MARKKVVEPDPNIIDLGPSTELPTKSTLDDADWNFVLIHRSNEPIISWWGNLCGRIERKLVIRSEDGKPIRWYHHKLFDYVSNQCRTYGDYYRVLDNSFGTAEQDTFYEEKYD